MAVGKQHHQTVDTDALTGRRRQTVFQRGDEVGVIEHRLVVARFLLLHLRLEALGLIFGIVELGEAVSQLATADKELEAIGDLRVVIVATRQRRHGGRVLGDEGRLHQLRFGGLFEDGGDDMAQLPALHQLDMVTLGHRDSAFQGGQLFSLHIVAVLEDRLDHGQTGERLTEVDLEALFPFLGVTDGGGAVDVQRQGAQHLLGEIHQIAVIGIGHIEFQHGEFWVMANGDPLVPEVTVDFVHALEATDHQTLQIELGGNTQVHVDIQRIVMGDEGASGGTAWDHLHHGGFHFHELLGVQEVTDTVDHLVTDLEGLARLFVGNQIQVTLTATGFLIGQTLVLFRQRTQRLGQQTDVGNVHGEFTGIGTEYGPFHADDIAQIPLLELLVVEAFGQIVTGDIDLYLAAHVLQGGKRGLAHDAAGHDTTGDLHLGIQRRQLVGTLVTELLMDLAGDMVTAEVVRERIALLTQCRQLGAALGHLVVELLNVQFRGLILF